jgi:hypothetical protein
MTYTRGKTSLDEGSARCRGRYLHNTQQTPRVSTSLPLAGFEPAIPESKRPQTYVLNHTAIGISTLTFWSIKLVWTILIIFFLTSKTYCSSVTKTTLLLLLLGIICACCFDYRRHAKGILEGKPRGRRVDNTKWIFKKDGGREWTEFIWLSVRQVTASFGRGNELSGSIKCRWFLC